MSNYCKPSLRAYLAERFAPGQFVPLGGLLLLASLVGGREVSVGSLILQFLLVMGWLLQFRLWDDLHDLARDRLDHPERVLVRADSVRAIRWLAALLGVTNGCLTAGVLSWEVAVALYGPACLLLLGWYRVGPAGGLVHAHVVLLKYPLFVLMLMGGGAALSLPGSLVLFLVYLTFLVYELFHDHSLRAARNGRRVLLLEALLLVVTWFVVAGWGGGESSGVSLVLFMLAAGGALVAGRLWQSRSGGTGSRRIFVPSLLQLLVLTIVK